jgi:hypothetical protein
MKAGRVSSVPFDKEQADLSSDCEETRNEE